MLDRVLHGPGWPGSHFVAENYLELSWTPLAMCVLLHLAQVSFTSWQSERGIIMDDIAEF